MNEQIETISNIIYNNKEKFKDSEYKTILENLMILHRIIPDEEPIGLSESSVLDRVIIEKEKDLKEIKRMRKELLYNLCISYK